MKFNNNTRNTLDKIFKLSILLTYSDDKRIWNFNNYLLGYRTSKKKSIGIIDIQKNVFVLFKLILFIKNIILNGGKLLFVDANEVTSKLTYLKSMDLNQFCVCRPFNISGSLSNFGNMRWHLIKGGSLNFPYKKPSALLVLDNSQLYYPIIREAFNLSMPVIAPLNFNTIKFHKKIPYPLMLSNLNNSNKKIFYFELFTYLIALCHPINYINIPNYHYWRLYLMKSFTKENYADLLFGRYPPVFIDKTDDELSPIFISYNKSAHNPVSRKLWSFTLTRRRTKNLRVQLYDHNKNKKWQWYRKKKFKHIKLYVKNFITKGKFRAPFSKIKWRYMLLKKIFCNLFDLQYNFKTWWREVIKKGLYKKIKKFSKNFKSSENFLLNSERYFVFLIRKCFNASFKSLSNSVGEGLFLVNGKVKNNPQYVVKNNSIIQKKLFNNNVNIGFDILSEERWKMLFFWKQRFFIQYYNLDVSDPLYNKKGIPLIPPYRIDSLGKKKLFEIYMKKVAFWKKLGVFSRMTRKRQLIKLIIKLKKNFKKLRIKKTPYIINKLNANKSIFDVIKFKDLEAHTKLSKHD